MNTSQIKAILSSYPKDWVGTTYANLDLQGRGPWSERLLKLLASSNDFTTSDLEALGNAEDYFRVSSNFSCVLETYLSVTSGLNNIDQVFTFASTSFPFCAVAMATGLPLRITGPSPFNPSDTTILSTIGVAFTDSEEPAVNVTVLADKGDTFVPNVEDFKGEDAVVCNSVLYIINTDKIPVKDVLVRRKRMSSPFTTDYCKHILSLVAGASTTYASIPSTDSMTSFLTHLQTMSGATSDTANPPVPFTVGLAALNSLWLSMASDGGADVLMASTAYGGSSEMTDLMVKHCNGSIRKHKFHVQGTNDMVESVKSALSGLRSMGGLKLSTVLCAEIPTNPDMKVPDLKSVVELLQEHGKETGKSVHIIIDTTFAPASGVLAKIRDIDPSMSAMCFISMSKSVSRGLTCAGAIVSNDTDSSKALLSRVRSSSRILDTGAKNDQLQVLCDNHTGVEERCMKAYKLAREIGDALQDEVKKMTGAGMPLAFVSPANAADKFTSSTFSFNLPPPNGASPADLAALAQRFVDILQEDRTLFKPCVSFGQDNGKTYATVPATSTQGAIKEEDKAKQSVGGVQLTRLSFPVETEKERLEGLVRKAVGVIYG